MKARVVSAAALVLALAACSAEEPRLSTTTPSETTTAVASSSTPTPTPTPTPEPEPEDIRAAAASLMVVGVTDFDSALAALNQGVGGIFIASWADSAILTEPGRDIQALREIVGRPFSVSIDFEGGRVQRHTDVFGEFMSPRSMTAMAPEEVRALAFDIGTRLRDAGVTVDYAPLLDLDVAGLDVMGDRSFGSDPHVAATYGVAFAQGLADAGVTPTFKHFPGHGQASADTHEGQAVTPPLDQLLTADLAPYAEALPQVPTASVMMGHMVVPGLGDGATPATLNPAAYELLRSGNYPGGAPFEGVIVTDDLSGMKAITDQMSTADAVTRAIGAGADQVLWSSGSDIAGAIDNVVAAVDAGTIPRERIDEAAARVAQQHENAGLN